jgi:hypothetical protein
VIFTQISGAAVANSAVMSSPLYVAGPVASAGHPTVATHDAIPAIKRRAAAATVASVNRGTT